MNSKQISYKMDTIFINLNSKTSGPDRLLLNFSHKINLKRSVKVVALLNLSIYYTWKDTKNSFKNNKLTTSAQTQNDKIQLLDGSYSVSDIQYYFEYIIKSMKWGLIILQ